MHDVESCDHLCNVAAAAAIYVRDESLMARGAVQHTDDTRGGGMR